MGCSGRGPGFPFSTNFQPVTTQSIHMLSLEEDCIGKQLSVNPPQEITVGPVKVNRTLCYMTCRQ